MSACSGHRWRRVVEVAAAVPSYPSKSELAAAEVAPCAYGRNGGQIRRRLASARSCPSQPHPPSPVQYPRQIHARGARSGSQKRRLLTPYTRQSPWRSQQCRARSADVAPAADQRWRWSRRASSPQSSIVAAPATVLCRSSAVEVEPARLPPTNAMPAAVPCWIRIPPVDAAPALDATLSGLTCHRHSSSTLVLLVPEPPPPPLLLVAKPSPIRKMWRGRGKVCVGCGWLFVVRELKIYSDYGWGLRQIEFAWGWAGW
uniref:Uncharacterized protein n=1 Tax=Oryza glumipatula TaxID=40148 RepID=A0A0E0B873_9ORYZ